MVLIPGIETCDFFGAYIHDFKLANIRSIGVNRNSTLGMSRMCGNYTGTALKICLTSELAQGRAFKVAASGAAIHKRPP